MLSLFFIVSCQSLEDRQVNASLKDSNALSSTKILVSTYVLGTLTENSIASHSKVDLEYIYPDSDQDPGLSTPSETMRKQLQSASLIILNGARFEKGLATVDMPRSKILRTAQSFKETWLSYPDSFRVDHEHGQSSRHQHTGIDGHTWLSPRLLKKQYNALIKRLGLLNLSLDQSAIKSIQSQIDQLQSRWRQVGIRLKSFLLIASHPAYQYLMQELGLEMSHIHFSPRELPSEESLRTLDDFFKTHSLNSSKQAPLMWWETQPSKAVVSALSRFKLTHVVLRPLEKEPTPNLGLFKSFHNDLNLIEQSIDE